MVDSCNLSYKQTKFTDFLKFFQTMLEFNNYKSMWIIRYTNFQLPTVKNSDRLEVFDNSMLLSSIVGTLSYSHGEIIT